MGSCSAILDTAADSAARQEDKMKALEDMTHEEIEQEVDQMVENHVVC